VAVDSAFVLMEWIEKRQKVFEMKWRSLDSIGFGAFDDVNVM
jgi:hypothetical protein